ncbi:MAG: hypothetical protein PWP65_1202 [Clostridia bacterium]|nr:hypothetical protein [Clostridia bacterium]
MKVIYHCFGGAHSSVTAAAIHLGLLPRDRLPTTEELLSLPYFDASPEGRQGQFQYMGRDEKGNEVYCVGRRGLGEYFQALVKGLVSALNIKEEILLLDTSSCVNWLMVAGGYISRRLGAVRLGRPVVVLGTLKAYPCLLSLVESNRCKWG